MTTPTQKQAERTRCPKCNLELSEIEPGLRFCPDCETEFVAKCDSTNPVVQKLFAASESFADMPERTQHTPGPWSKPWQISGRENQSEVMIDKYHYAGCQSVVVKGQDHEANARLIAAAPELLAKCGMALDILLSDGYGESSSPVTQLRAAIAKAEGRAE